MINGCLSIQMQRNRNLADNNHLRWPGVKSTAGKVLLVLMNAFLDGSISINYLR